MVAGTMESAREKVRAFHEQPLQSGLDLCALSEVGVVYAIPICFASAFNLSMSSDVVIRVENVG